MTQHFRRDMLSRSWLRHSVLFEHRPRGAHSWQEVKATGRMARTGSGRTESGVREERETWAQEKQRDLWRGAKPGRTGKVNNRNANRRATAPRHSDLTRHRTRGDEPAPGDTAKARRNGPSQAAFPVGPRTIRPRQAIGGGSQGRRGVASGFVSGVSGTGGGMEWPHPVRGGLACPRGV